MIDIAVSLPVAFLARLAGLIRARAVTIAGAAALIMAMSATARANLIFTGTGTDSDGLGYLGNRRIFTHRWYFSAYSH